LKTSRYCNIVTSEFPINREGNDTPGQIAGGPERLKEIVEESLDVRVLTRKLEALQCAAAYFLCNTDVDEAYACGVKSISFPLDDLTEKMVTILRFDGNRYARNSTLRIWPTFAGMRSRLPNIGRMTIEI
jgi:hypothetical protein